MSLDGVELGGGRVDLALEGLELLLRAGGRGLGLGESPARRIGFALEAGLLGRKRLVLTLQRRDVIGFVLEPCIDGLKVARPGACLLLGAGNGEFGVTDLFGEIRELRFGPTPWRPRRPTALSRRRPPAS